MVAYISIFLEIYISKLLKNNNYINITNYNNLNIGNYKTI